MGNGFEIDLNKYKCSCFQCEDNCFINFVNGNSQDPFNFITSPDKLSASELQENTPGGLRYPNDNMVKSSLKKKETMNKRKNINLFNDNELEKETNDDNINGKKTFNNTNKINIDDEYDEEQKEKDIKDFDKKTNYFILAKQVNNAINELKKNNNNNKNQELKLEFGNYIGQVINGKAEGKGICNFFNGDRYEGEWKDNKKEGKGVYYWNRSPWKGDVFEGEWKNNKKEGKGIYYFSDGDFYEGNWKNGKQDGKGIYYYSDGDIYDGEWKNGVKEGKGIHYFSNGDVYEGDFKDNNFEGKGIRYFRNGDRIMGDYSNDFPIGCHVRLTAMNTILVENF